MAGVDVAIDMHTHVLPGIDDGPPDLAGALAFAERAAADGTTTLVATPHVSPRYPNGADAIDLAVTAVNRAIDSDGIALRVLAGAEVAHTMLPDLPDAELARLTLGGGPTLLLEAPLTAVGPEFEACCEALRKSGYRVLLAHPERAPSFQREPERLAALVRRGARCSITATSLSGRFGSTVRRFAWKLLEDGLVHNVASDAHDALGRTPELRGVLAEGVGREAFAAAEVSWLTRDVPAALLAGAPLPERPGAPAKRGGGRGMLRRPWRG